MKKCEGKITIAFKNKSKNHLSPAIAGPLLTPFVEKDMGPSTEELTIPFTTSSSSATRFSLITFLLRQPVFLFPVPTTTFKEETPHG